jgi:serine/threonine protein kinase
MICQQVCTVKKLEFGLNKQKQLSIMHNEIKVLEIIKLRNWIKYLDSWIGEDYCLVLNEFIENGSLHDILHEKNPPPPLTWNVRFNIVVRIAKRLAYLHNCDPSIVHRDIKPKKYSY